MIRFIANLWIVMMGLPFLVSQVYGNSLFGLAAGYVIASIVTMLLYRADKIYAQRQAGRIPERILHFWELVGGWPGALLAQRIFHHKNAKFSYQLMFFVIVVLNIAAAVFFLHYV